MNIIEIINRMNSSQNEAISEEEHEFFENNYDAGTMPAIDPTADWFVYETYVVGDDPEMDDELAYDAEVFNQAMEGIEFNPDALIPEGDGDDYSPVNDGSWYGR